MTDEEKLLLQGARKATAPALSVTATATGGIAPPAKMVAAPAPALAPAPLVTSDPDDGLPPAAEGLDPLPDTDASGADIRAAAWDAETIKTDAWNYTQGKRNALATDMFARLPADARARVTARRWDHENNWTSFEAMVMDEAAKSAIAAPQDWADVPLNMDAFDARITKERRADLDEAMAILNQPGGGFSEFLGSGARAMTDQASLLMAPLGFGSGSALRIIAGEAALGAIGEAAVIPREQQVASELGIAQPDVLSRLAMGAAMGAGLSGAVLGIGKAAGMVFGRRAGIDAVTPATGDQLTSEIAIDKAEAELRGDPTVQEAINGSTAPLPGAENLPYNEAATLRAIIGVESGGQARAKNPASSATGLGQFIGSTWLSMIRKYRPDVAAGKTGNEILDLRNNGALSAEMTAMYARETATTLQANGITVDPGGIYLGHFMGPGGAVKALKAPLDTPISALMSPKEIAANAGIKYDGKSFANFTAGDLRRWSAHKMRSAYDPNASRNMPDYSGPTSRGYTGNGQVTAGDGATIDVEYQVVDLGSIFNASGDFQPRDRSRIASDAWVSDTAARLDPAQLMPSPTADKGAPIVGPDDMIESGNGRSMAIARAYAVAPARAAAYRAQIEAAGYAIPEGMARPVLIARRTSALTREERVRFTVDAQDSGVAAMTPIEVARASSRAMTSPVLGQLDPVQPISSVANAGFVRAALAGLPRSARNAMFDAGGMLNKNGERQLREALFARAWSDPDILEMFTDAEQGDLKSLMEALDRSAPSWAALKADIETGAVRPEMDISGHVLDAMRLIASARAIAKGDKISIANALSELLEATDLLNGAVAPLTVAMVGKFWRGGRAASADDVAAFLTRYADDARKAGATGGMFDGPTPRDVLRAIDKDAFGDLPENLGPVRGFATPAQAVPVRPAATGYDAGATAPEAEAADLAARDALENPVTADNTPGLQRDIDPDLEAAQADISDARATYADDLDSTEIDAGDGTKTTMREFLADLDADAEMVSALRACAIEQRVS